MKHAEIIEIELNTPEEVCLHGQIVDMILFDGQGFGITESSEHIIMKYPCISELTEEQTEDIAFYRFGSAYWKKEFGDRPAYGDVAITFGQCKVVLAEEYAQELTQSLIQNSKNIKS